MAESLRMRATSLAASAMLVGAALIGALSVRYVQSHAPITDTIIFEGLNEPPREPPPRADPPRTSPPPQTQTVPYDAPFEPPPLLPISSVPEATGPMIPTLTTMTNPEWLRRPANLERYYPRRARQLGVEGQVMLDCRVGLTGALTCVVAAETPPNWGFAEAALRIAGEHQMRPAMRGGAPVEARYVMRVPFALE